MTPKASLQFLCKVTRAILCFAHGWYSFLCVCVQEAMEGATVEGYHIEMRSTVEPPPWSVFDPAIIAQLRVKLADMAPTPPVVQEAKRCVDEDREDNAKRPKIDSVEQPSSAVGPAPNEDHRPLGPSAGGDAKGVSPALLEPNTDVAIVISSSFNIPSLLWVTYVSDVRRIIKDRDGDKRGFDDEWFCGICTKNFGPRPMVCCDTCSSGPGKTWAHIRCSGLPTGRSKGQYEAMTWSCPYCVASKMPHAYGTVTPHCGGDASLVPVRLLFPIFAPGDPTKVVWKSNQNYPVIHVRRTHLIPSDLANRR